MALPTSVPILAHSWGWDEMLYVALPVAAVLVFVRWVDRRAREKAGDDPSATMPARDDHPEGES